MDSGESTSEEIALIVGGGPGISASCARLFASEGMQVAVAARNVEKEVLRQLMKLPKCELKLREGKLFQKLTP